MTEPITFLTPSRLRRRQGSKWWTFPPDILPFTPAEADFAICPAVQDSLENLVAHQQYGYPRKDGEGPLASAKSAFVVHAERSYGWQIDAADISILPSTSQAIFGSFRAFSKPGDGVILQSPAYPGFYKMIESARRHAIIDRLIDTEFGPSPDPRVHALDGASQAAIWLLCHPHNPTGRIFTRDELAPLAREASQSGMLVISDELHADLCLDDRRHRPFITMFPELARQTITLHSATKTYGIAGLGGVVAHFGDRSLMERFNQANPTDLIGRPNVATLIASAAAWRNGLSWKENLVKVLASNRDRFIRRLEKELPEVRIWKPEATYFLWADFAALNLSENPARQLLEHGRIASSDGSAFGAEFSTFARFVSACGPAILDDLMDRLVEVARSTVR